MISALRSLDGIGLAQECVRGEGYVDAAAVLLHGLSTTDFPHAADLPPKTKAALEPLLRAQGFDPRRAIHVDQLPDDQGFRLTQ
jgi:hypothetical protein